MATELYRLQLSLPAWQVRFLRARARRDGVSMAEIVRQMIARESESDYAQAVSSVWEIAGIGREHEPLINGLLVSEAPDLYLNDLASRPLRDKKSGYRARRSRKGK